MGWSNKFPSVLLIFALNLINYFARSFPVLTYYETNPALGPYFEGDIKSNPWGRNGIPDEIYRWKKGILKFYVQDGYTFKEMTQIYKAILEIIMLTCIEVEELLASGPFDDHVFYSPELPTCAADVGFRGWRQIIDLGPGCLSVGHGIAIHETLHALGFYHEQSREDRDEYITINLKNVLPSNRHNFNIYPSKTYGFPYDYGSIMHYGPYEFAIDRKVKVIEAKQPGAQYGQRMGLSTSDIDKVNHMYKEECDSRSKQQAFNIYASLGHW